jgi:hypothetical protein
VLAAILPLLLAAPYAWEESGPRLDHRGQLSLDIAPVFEQLVATGNGASEPALIGELLLGVPLGNEGQVLVVGGRGGWGAPLAGSRARAVAPYVGYRGYAGGDEPWKTFFDAGAFVRVAPVIGVGVRIGGGLQLDVAENLGFFLSGGLGLAGGDGVQLGADVGLGVQLRFGAAGS